MSAAQVLLTVIGLTGGLVIAWATVRFPAWAVAMVVASVPLQAFARIGSSDSGFTWTQAWTWSLLATAMVLFANGTLVVRLDLSSALFAAVVVCYIVTSSTHIVEVTWRNEVYRWSVALGFFVVARAILRGVRAVKPLLAVTTLGAVWTGVVAVVQVARSSGPESFKRGGQPRAYASFGEPNTFGAFAAGCLVILVACLMFGRFDERPWTSRFSGVGAAFAAVGLMSSQSRGAIAATVVILGAMSLIKLNGHRSLNRVARVAAVIAIAVAAMSVVPELARRAAPGEGPSEVATNSWADQERLAHWGAAIRMVVDSRGLGVGAGQFDQRYRELTPTWRFRIPQGHAHNAYLQVAAEAGLLGAAVYVSLLGSVAGVLCRRRRRFPASAVVLAATGVFALHNLVDYLHVLNLPIILLAWWASALGEGDGLTTTS